MSRLTVLLLPAFLSEAATADVLDHGSGLLERLFHQLFAVHHLPFTALLIVVGILALRSWRTVSK